MTVRRGETSQLLEILERVADGGVQVDVREKMAGSGGESPAASASAGSEAGAGASQPTQDESVALPDHEMDDV